MVHPSSRHDAALEVAPTELVRALASAVFEQYDLDLVDVLACACGGRRAILADISERDVVMAVSAHLGLPTEAPPIAWARSPGFDFTYTAPARAEDEGAMMSRGRRCAAKTTCARVGGSLS